MSEAKKTINVKKNMKFIISVFVILFSGMIVYLGYAVTVYGERWFASPYNQRLEAANSNVIKGSVLDTNGVKLAWTEDGERQYISDTDTRIAISHTLGDNYGMTQGAELLYAKYLFGFDSDIVSRVGELITGEKRKGSDVTLTIDSELCKYAASVMGDNSGAIVLINYETGEILASVSQPGFDPLSVSDYADDEDSTVLFNRVTMGKYPPGSTFKIITATAIIQEGLQDESYTCTGSVDIGGITIECAGGKAHGELTLEEAFNVSCNTYFATMAKEIGSKKLLSVAEKYGFNYDFLFNDMILYQSDYVQSDYDENVALSGIGQYEDLITPLHSAMISGAIANGGTMMQPMLLKAVTTAEGNETDSPSKVFKSDATGGTASVLKQLMISEVKNGTGKSAAVEGLTIGGKTGTAEYTEGGETKEHAWFTGFIADEDHPLAIAVILEGAGSGGKNSAPIASKVFKKAVELGY